MAKQHPNSQSIRKNAHTITTRRETSPPGKSSIGRPKLDAYHSAETSKQDEIIALLSSHAGVTVAVMMQQTGWQPHSVRGFLAGVVRKRLKLKLTSRVVDGDRVYRITGGCRKKSKAAMAPAD